MKQFFSVARQHRGPKNIDRRKWMQALVFRLRCHIIEYKTAKEKTKGMMHQDDTFRKQYFELHIVDELMKIEIEIATSY